MPAYLRNRLGLLHSYWQRAPRAGGLPVRMTVEFTNRCNLACRKCPRRGDRPEHEMPLSLWRAIAPQLRASVEQVTMVMAGESLLYAHFAEACAIAKASALRLCLHTNAVALDEAGADLILNAGFEELVISLDAHSPEVYRTLTGNDGYARVRDNILGFCARKKAQAGRQPLVIIQCIEQPENSAELTALRKFWRAIPGVDLVRIKPFFNLGGMTVRPPARRRWPCFVPWREMAIYCDGRAAACCCDLTGEVVIGDLTRQTLAEVWNSEAMCAFRSSQLGPAAAAPAVCRACSIATPHPLVLLAASACNASTVKLGTLALDYCQQRFGITPFRYH